MLPVASPLVHLIPSVLSRVNRSGFSPTDTPGLPPCCLSRGDNGSDPNWGIFLLTGRIYSSAFRLPNMPGLFLPGSSPAYK